MIIKMNGSLLTYNDKIYIVGAQSRAKTLTGYLSFLYPKIAIEAYLVDDLSQNDSSIQGVRVYELRESSPLDLKLPVFIATKGIYHVGIEEQLKQIGFHTVIPVTVDVDNWLRNAYVEKCFETANRSFIKLENMQLSDSNRQSAVDLKACIYMAKSIYDKPLQSSYMSPFYERAIQVGAALTDDRLELGILTDSDGDNISSKNRQYCELTALYWIWRHAAEDVIGLSHYRRHFILPDYWLEIMACNNIDVVLPVPTYVASSIDGNYRERHDPSDWGYLLEYLKDNLSEDYEIAKTVFSGNLYSPCNMFIMRRDILNELCTWMFPILDAVVEHGGEKEDTYLNRYPGFISERLITLFFYKNRDKYKIAYADRSFTS